MFITVFSPLSQDGGRPHPHLPRCTAKRVSVRQYALQRRHSHHNMNGAANMAAAAAAVAARRHAYTTVSSTDTNGEEEDEEEEGRKPAKSKKLPPRRTAPKPPPHETFLYKFWNCLKGSHDYRKRKAKSGQMGVNSVSQIDVISRLVFPGSFVIFNTAYWYWYLSVKT